MTELHLTDAQLAALVDESLGDSERAFLVEHLRSCEPCHAAYRDTVRYRAILLSDSTVFRAPDAVVDLARRVARPAAPAREPRMRWFEPRLVAGLTAAAVVVIAGVAWYTHHQPASYSEYLPPLKQAAAVATADGSIVLPGVEEVVAATSTEHRTGFVQPDDAITAALAGLTAAYRDHPNPDVAHWLISGCLATGDVETSRLYIQDARLRFPEDTRFLVLDAIVAYRTSDMARAENLLRTALDANPHDGAALLNLALVQYESGQLDSARRTLQMVQTQFAGSPLEARATTLISDLLNG
ncbi:MAG TPA: tetratricopeptide repeat protein [Candidatus Krumholzibacteria bacterium]